MAVAENCDLQLSIVFTEANQNCHLNLVSCQFKTLHGFFLAL